MEPNSIEIGAEQIADVARVTAARPTQSDISSAMPAENAVHTQDAHGASRVDYRGVKIKNADGTLNKYGRRLIEMHEKQARLGAELSLKVSGATPVETLRTGDGQPLKVPARLADAVARARGLRAVPHYGKRLTSKTYYHADGRIVRFERRGGKMVEVPAAEATG